jgi:hypothetical protein
VFFTEWAEKIFDSALLWRLLLLLLVVVVVLVVVEEDWGAAFRG